jgi:hypothetical protein
MSTVSALTRGVAEKKMWEQGALLQSVEYRNFVKEYN